jgi:hypothetical protein
MMRLSVALFVGALALAAALYGPQLAQADPQPNAASTTRIVQMLQNDIDLRNVELPVKLKQVLEYVSRELTRLNRGKEIVVLVDYPGFKAANDDITLDQILDSDVPIPAYPRRLKMATLLRIALDSLPTRNATYLVRPGLLEITTLEKARPKALLERRISASFAETPLRAAMLELTDQAGASLVLDVRVHERLKEPVTVTFRHDTTLGAALRMLADMAGLKLVVLNSGLYVTTPQRARTLQHEERRRLQEKPKMLPSEEEAAMAAVEGENGQEIPVDRNAYLEPLQRRVSGTFDQYPLEEALQELSDQTNVSIVLDRRVGKKAQTPVTADWISDDVTLSAAARVLADLAGLEAVMVDNVIYVTTPARARHLRRVLERALYGPFLAMPALK